MMKGIRIAGAVLLMACAFHGARASGEAALEGTWVGTGAVDITPPVGVPLAGYGGPPRRMFPDLFNKYKYATYLKPSTGVHDPIRAKALVILNRNHAVLFMSLDLIGVDYPFYREIKAYAHTLGIDDVFISATHTHSGPGALSRSWIFALIAADRFVRPVYEKVLAGTKQAVDVAVQNLERAHLVKSKFQVEKVQRNRRHRDGHFDPDARMLTALNGKNEVLGGLINFAVHPIAFGEDNLEFSADFAGGIERHVKDRLKSKGEFLFMNGAEGDVSTEVDGAAGIEKDGERFAQAAETGLITAIPMGEEWSTRSNSFYLPKAGLALWACDEKLLGRVFGKKFRLPIGKRALPTLTEVKEIEFSDGTLMMSWPGEATTDLGFQLRERARAAGYEDAWNLGLTNGYMGYFVTPEEFKAGGYEVCVAYHGPKAGMQLLEAHQALLDSNPRH